MNSKSVAVRLLGLCVVAMAALPWSVASAAIVTFEPGNATGDLGTGISMNLVGTEFPDNMDGGGVNITFDPTVVIATLVVVNTALWDFEPATDAGTIDNSAGTITDITFGTFQSVTPADPLFATVTFEAVGLGVSELGLSESFAQGGFVAGAVPLEVTFDNGSITVVPLPAAFWLFLPALGFLAGFRRTRMA